MRAFVALDVARSVRERIEELESELKQKLPRARFVPAANLHFTLRFLGESTEEQLGAIARDLETAVAAIPPFVLHVKGCGAFPNARRARVLWVGVEDAPDALFELHRAVERSARSAGFTAEKRRFEPHLTITRFREPPRDLESLLSAFLDCELGASGVDGVVVYESRLSPRGATYDALHRVRLAGPGGTEGKRLV